MVILRLPNGRRNGCGRRHFMHLPRRGELCTSGLIPLREKLITIKDFVSLSGLE